MSKQGEPTGWMPEFAGAAPGFCLFMSIYGILMVPCFCLELGYSNVKYCDLGQHMGGTVCARHLIMVPVCISRDSSCTSVFLSQLLEDLIPPTEPVGRD